LAASGTVAILAMGHLNVGELKQLLASVAAFLLFWR
jgi:hypothetical protein